MKTKWKQCPSVTMGGKLYFWIASDETGKPFGRVVWNRFLHKWESSVDQLSLGFFTTLAAAKKAVKPL